MIENKFVNLFFEIVGYLHFFLKGFVEDLLDLWGKIVLTEFFDRIFFYFFFCRLCDIFCSFWRPFGCFLKWKFSFGFFWEIVFGDRIFWSEFFFFCRLCDIFGSFWRVLLKTFWVLFEVKIQFWIFLGNFFWWQNILVRIFFFCRLCDIFGSFWRVLWKTFWMLFEVKIQFWIFWGNFFWWQNFLVRIFIFRFFRFFFFFFVDCVFGDRIFWSEFFFL